MNFISTYPPLKLSIGNTRSTPFKITFPKIYRNLFPIIIELIILSIAILQTFIKPCVEHERHFLSTLESNESLIITK